VAKVARPLASPTPANHLSGQMAGFSGRMSPTTTIPQSSKTESLVRVDRVSPPPKEIWPSDWTQFLALGKATYTSVGHCLLISEILLQACVAPFVKASEIITTPYPHEHRGMLKVRRITNCFEKLPKPPHAAAVLWRTGPAFVSITERTTKTGKSRDKFHDPARAHPASKRIKHIARDNLGAKKQRSTRCKARSTLQTIAGAAVKEIVYPEGNRTRRRGKVLRTPRQRPRRVVIEDLSRQRNRARSEKIPDVLYIDVLRERTAHHGTCVRRRFRRGNRQRGLHQPNLSRPRVCPSGEP